MDEYCVYKHTSPSGKVYIGVTMYKPEARWRNGKGYRGNKYFSRAILKYGWNNFNHYIIAEGLSYDDASNMEIGLIAIHNATNKDCGYNIGHGGNVCGTHSEETRHKMSIAAMGRERSPEARAKMSIACMGRKLSEYTKFLVSKNNPQKRAVDQIDLSGNVIARFCSSVDAANSVNACSSHIGEVCKGTRKTCGGFKWRYYDEKIVEEQL